MRYIDSGTRNEFNALGSWLRDELASEITAFRIQTGFYSREALAPFRQDLTDLSVGGHTVHVVVGSNDGGTLAQHLEELAGALQLPSLNAKLGVVYFQNAYFHPKTYHFERADGSQTAYVGSANFTLPGVSARHIEAGLIIDSRDGDSIEVLSDIAKATDHWFEAPVPGFENVESIQRIQQLLTAGVVRSAPIPRPPRPAGPSGQPPQRPQLNALITLVNPPTPPTIVQPVAWQPLPTEQRTPPYPPYIFFAPNTDEPTVGAEALTNNSLGDAAGLIIKLSRDNDRHWRQQEGTANVSIPVSTATTIRFGVYKGKRRPRAEFGFFSRYLSDNVVIAGQPSEAGIMSYGFTPGDSGHGDLRLNIPSTPIKAMREVLVEQNIAVPVAGDLALLEWPTPTAPSFRMTFLDPNSNKGVAAMDIWRQAAANEQLASRGACWLPADFSPAW